MSEHSRSFPQMATIRDMLDAAVKHHQGGDLPKTRELYLQILGSEPRHAEALHLFGVLAHQVGQSDVAVDYIGRSLQIQPNHAEAQFNLGIVLNSQGKPDRAAACLQRAISLKPNYAEAHNNLGEALRETGKLDAALEHLNAALNIRPNYADARINLGSVYYQTGREKDAVAQFDEAVKINPEAISALNNLSWILAVSTNEAVRNPARALELAQKANELTGGNHPTILQTLAAAYAANGHFVEADETAEKALFLANSQGNGTLADLIRGARRYYQAGKPLPPAPSATTETPSAAPSHP
jgi:tetratricopeptide (TPR) repeat protein